MKKLKTNIDVNNISLIKGRIEILDEHMLIIAILPMHSLLSNFTKGISYKMFGTSISGQKNNLGNTIAGGTQLTLDGSSIYIQIGVSIGSGTVTDPNIDTYALNNMVSSDNFDFSEITVTRYESGTTKLIKITRRYYNKSASPISITEIGLAARTGISNYVLLAYDILDTPYSFVNGTYVYFSIVLSDSTTYDIMPNFFKILLGKFKSVTELLLDTSNVTRSNGYALSSLAITNVNTYGVQIGSGTTPNTSETYNIETNLLLNSSESALAYSNNTLTAYRLFLNNTAEAIVIKLVALTLQATGTGSYKYLIYRKCLSEANYITLQPNDTAVVLITIKISPS